MYVHYPNSKELTSEVQDLLALMRETFVRTFAQEAQKVRFRCSVYLIARVANVFEHICGKRRYLVAAGQLIKACQIS